MALQIMALIVGILAIVGGFIVGNMYPMVAVWTAIALTSVVLASLVFKGLGKMVVKMIEGVVGIIPGIGMFLVSIWGAFILGLLVSFVRTMIA